MKKYTTAIILSVSVLTLAGATATAQEKKNVKRSIIINNGDTTVNGKKFTELEPAERARVREEFREMSESFRAMRPDNIDRIIVRKGRKGSIDVNAPNVLFWDDNPDDMIIEMRKGAPRDASAFMFRGDSSRRFGFEIDSLIRGLEIRGLDSTMRRRITALHRDGLPRFFDGMGGGMVFRAPGRPAPIAPFAGRNNSSTFNYNHVDKDGISSRLSIRISDLSKDQLKKATGSDEIKTLDINDLTLFPNFSSGKVTLSFGSESKGRLKVAILDGDFKSIFNDDVTSFSGIYLKQLSLPRNGVYYVTINQGDKWYTKRVVKE